MPTMTAERPSRTRYAGATLDPALVRRADRKLRRYGSSVSGLLASIVDRRGLRGAAILPAQEDFPATIDFTAQGQRFTADVKADPWGGYTAIVRGHEDCYTDGDTIPELRKALVEVVELMVFDMGTPITDEAIDF